MPAFTRATATDPPAARAAPAPREAPAEKAAPAPAPAAPRGHPTADPRRSAPVAPRRRGAGGV